MTLRSGAVGLLVVLVWSACFVVIKASRGDAPPALYAALRALLGGLLLLAVAAARSVALPPPGMWGWIVLLAVTNTTIGLGGMFLAVGLAGAALPAVLANSQALLVAPLAALLFRERLGPGRVAGLLLGLVGVGLTLRTEVNVPGSWKGAAVALLSAAGLAVANLVTKHIGTSVDAVTATGWQYLLGAMPLLAWSLAGEDAGRIVWSWRFLAGLVFLGLAGSAGAPWVWYRLVRDDELIPLNALTLLTPPFAFVLAVAIYQERVTSEALIGIGAVLVGVAWVAWPRQTALALAAMAYGERDGATKARLLEEESGPMARGVMRARVGRTTARLVEEFAERWGEQAARALPQEVRTHARASIREGLLAMASIWEETLRGIEREREKCAAVSREGVRP